MPLYDIDYLKDKPYTHLLQSKPIIVDTDTRNIDYSDFSVYFGNFKQDSLSQ